MRASHERTSGPWRSLSLPWVYSSFQRRLSIAGARAHVVERYIRARPGDSVLDLGCGPADILDYLPAIHYLGIDASAEYLAEARRRFGDRTPPPRFLQMDLHALADIGERFDLVLAQGLLHHFDDDHANALLGRVATLMKPGSRLITVDATRTPDQRLIARLLVSSDRGRFVRPPEGYERLARQVFSRVELHVRHDLMRLPYTHVFMECSDPYSRQP